MIPTNKNSATHLLIFMDDLIKETYEIFNEYIHFNL